MIPIFFIGRHHAYATQAFGHCQSGRCFLYRFICAGPHRARRTGVTGLIPEAFHGTEDVVAGVQTRTLTSEEQAYIGLHARAFTPSTRIETIPGR